MMQTYQIETTVSEEGILKILGLPLHTGDKVKVIVKKQSTADNKNSLYPLRGKPVHYKAPYESVAEEEWLSTNNIR
ncbi:MAG: hypothetical protein KAW12_02980 [Candidatus Aminicenantes bacterium]|nr:hypothetical protein [Candidatus Aminicenantes bacterium]